MPQTVLRFRNPAGYRGAARLFSRRPASARAGSSRRITTSPCAFSATSTRASAQALAADLAETENFSRRRALRLELDEIGVFGGHQPRALYRARKARPAADAGCRRRMNPSPAAMAWRRKPANSRRMSLWRGCAASSRRPSAPGCRNGPYPLALSFEAARFVLYSSRDSVGGGPLSDRGRSILSQTGIKARRARR